MQSTFLKIVILLSLLMQFRALPAASKSAISVDLVNLKAAHLTFYRTALIKLIYEETRYIPFLTYEYQKGSHSAFGGTNLPRQKTEWLYVPVVFTGDSAHFEIRNIKKSIISLGGYRLRNIELEYAMGQGKNTESYIAYLEIKKKKGMSGPPQVTRIRMFPGYFNPVTTGKTYGSSPAVNRIQLTVDAARYVRIEFAPKSNSAGYWQKAGWTGWEKKIDRLEQPESGAIFRKGRLTMPVKSEVILPVLIHHKRNAPVMTGSMIVKTDAEINSLMKSGYPLLRKKLWKTMKKNTVPAGRVRLKNSLYKQKKFLQIKHLRVISGGKTGGPYQLCVSAWNQDDLFAGFSCMTIVIE